jgi:tetratricopeptide (TPR) repeat protein
MKVPFSLHKRPEAADVRGLLLLSDTAADLVGLYAALGADPLPDTFTVPGGFLLKLTNPVSHAFPQTIRLRHLSPDLFLPADADLLPPLLDDEAAALVRNRGLIFLPGGRVLAYEPDRPLPPATLLRVANVRRGDWSALPERPPRAERLHEILLDRPQETPDDVLEAGGEDIATEEPRPDDASLPSKVSGKASFGIGKALINLGNALGWKGLATFGAKMVHSALEKVPRLSESVLGAQEAALRALLREFREGNLEKALRRALPLGSEGDRGGTPAPNANLPTHNLRYSLTNLLGSDSRGGRTVWFGGGDVQALLGAEYRKAAQEAVRRGDYRRAAFIYGKLLRDYRTAANVLSHGGLHHDAAILYLDKLADSLAAARSFEAAGEFDRALELYRQREEHLLAADLLRKMGEEEAALEEYKQAADKLVRKNENYLAAGELMLERAGRIDLAMAYLHRGWALRPYGGALACLMRLAPLHAEEESPDAFLALLAEADSFFATVGHEESAGKFYNELARLAERPQQSARRDDLRDTALVGLANKLRQRSAQEEKPGPQAAALFGRSTLWAPAQVNDAEFAYKAALRPMRQSPAKKTTAPTCTYLGTGTITAVCTAPETGHVFIGFQSGRLICFDPHNKTTAEFPGSSLPVRAMSTDPAGRLVVVIRQKSELRTRCMTYRKSRYGLFDQMHEGRHGHLCLTSIVETSGYYFGLYSPDDFEVLFSDHMVPVAGLGHELGPRLDESIEAVLLVDETSNTQGGIEVLHFEIDSVFSCHTHRRETAHTALGWNVMPPQGALVSQTSLVWRQLDGAHCQIARVNADGGGVYWSHLHRDQGNWKLVASAVAAGHSGYQAVTILRPGRLAAVREGRIAWLRHGGKWLVPWSTQDLALPAAHACFFSPRTNELTVITKDNHAVCVPVPNG